MIPAAVILLLGAMTVSCVTVQYAEQESYYTTENITENIAEPYSYTTRITKGIPHEEALQPYILWSNPQLKFKGRPYIWYYGYDLSGFPVHAISNIKITFYKQRFYEYVSVSVFDMRRRGQLLAPPLISPSDNLSALIAEGSWITTQGSISTFNQWLGAANAKLDFARFLGGMTDLYLNVANPAPIEINTRGATDIALLIYGPGDPQNCRFNATMEWADTIAENVTAELHGAAVRQLEVPVMKQRPAVKTKQVPFWETLFNQPR